MCGRYVIISTPAAIRALFGYAEQPNFPPRYNVAPTQPIPIVRLVDGKRSFALMRWGLLPSWVKDPKAFPLLINARGESVLDKPAFRNAMRRRRCLIPADGFYEWKPTPSVGIKAGPPKQPYFVRAKRSADGGAPPLAFAGLYETWTGPNGEELDTAAIITTTANRTLSALHDRMPVFIAPDAFDLWLDCANVEADVAAALIRPAAEDFLEAYPVSTAVNRVANDSDVLLAPLPAAATATGAAAATDAVIVKPKPDKPKKAKEPDDQASLF
jgi:putative SOS response-associated peptidase YedK